jgi:hypothetical protein
MVQVSRTKPHGREQALHSALQLRKREGNRVAPPIGLMIG